MANPEHLELLKRDVDAWNAWREENQDVRPDLREADLREADLREADLNGANLSGADLSRADLGGALLGKANLTWADLHEANFRDADLSDADFGGAKLSGADLSKARFRDADLRGLDLRRTTVRGAHFWSANLRETKLSEVDLREADLHLADLGMADLREANLGGVKLLQAMLHRANLNRANLSGADLRLADLGDEANLSEANLSMADFREANLGGTNLCKTNLCNADLRRVTLIDSRLDGADLTGAKLWETQRGGWSIKGVVCRQAFWDRDGKELTEYGDGEFERLFAERPRIVLRYPGGVRPVDLFALPLIVEQLQAQHPGSKLHVRSVQDGAGGPQVTITVEDLAGRDDAAFREEVVRLQAKLECIEAERDRLADRLMPRLLDLIAMGRQTNIIGQITGGRTAIGGPVSGDTTYNTTAGQIGAVGPNAHVHGNTFQQVQASGIDLPKLAEELGRLRTAMKSDAETREQDKAVVAVGDAEEAAAKGDGAGALGHLKAAGKWTLDIAEKVGVPLAVEALKRMVP